MIRGRASADAWARPTSLSLVVMASALALSLTLSAAPAAGFDTVFERATFLAGSPAGPPPDNAPGWVEVELPDRWGQRRPDISGIGWYRLHFVLDRVPEAPIAAYIDHLSMNGELWLNGSWIGRQGRMEPPVAQNWNRPLLFALPTGLLRAGDNSLEIAIYRLPDCYGALGPVRIGDASDLSLLHARSSFWRVGVARAATVGSGLFAAIMLAFWLGTRDPAYGAFSAVCAAIAVSNLNFHVRDILISSQLWEALVCSAALLAAAAFWLFAQRLAARSRGWWESGLALYGVGILALFFVDHAVFHALFEVLGLLALALCAHAALVIANHTRREDRTSAMIYGAVGSAALVFIGHDVALQLGWLSQPARFLYPWVGPLLVAGFGAGLTRRFLRSFREAEGQRDLLVVRVEEKRTELESRFAELRVLERERLLSLERERIMREMHDGVGGHLVRTLSMLEGRGASRDELASELREALADMRLVIDSLDPSADDLGTKLGMLRTRLERILAPEGVELIWRTEALPALPHLGAEASLHVLRIVQEAVTNILRHAQATRLTLSAQLKTGKGGTPGVAIEVSDDGIGLAAGTVRGRGIANMERRAELLGALLFVRALEGGSGTSVALWIPVHSMGDGE